MWCLVEMCAIQLHSMYNISTIFWTLMIPNTLNTIQYEWFHPYMGLWINYTEYWTFKFNRLFGQTYIEHQLCFVKYHILIFIVIALLNSV